ncbi:MAG TPA: arginine deiminase family protein [Thermomicrobiales bacterium]
MTSITNAKTYGGQTNTAPLRRVLVYPPIAPDPSVSWEAFGYLRPLNHEQAVAEHAAFRQILNDAGIEIISGELDDAALQDGIFPYDPGITTDAGVILGWPGKPLREGEVAALEATLNEIGIPIAGRITPPGTFDGGDSFWLDERTLSVGHGYRTNAEGIRQLTAILSEQGIAVVVVPLPHWHGPAECLHLLSLISPLDERLAAVYRPLLPVPFLQELAARGWELIDVPDEEFASQGPNILALGPRRCVILKENAETIRRLRATGCEVITYTGDEISHNRTGGPTCLTRPLLRG